VSEVRELVEVPFYGDKMLATKVGNDVWVSIRRCCESMGLVYARQLQKLQAKPWAAVCMMYTVAQDGKTRETACLRRDKIPMWFATIDPGKVRPDVREKLVRYQCEAADVLARHFLPPKQVERAWSDRLSPTVMNHRSHVNRKHPGCWSIVTELIMDLLLIEDELFRCGFPLQIGYNRGIGGPNEPGQQSRQQPTQAAAASRHVPRPGPAPAAGARRPGLAPDP